MGCITSKPAFPPPPPRRWKKVLVEKNGKIVAKYVREETRTDDRGQQTK